MTNGRTMWIAMLLGCGIFAGAGRAETTVETPPPKFAVWTSSGCSRSLTRAEDFPEIYAALDAAEKLQRPQRFVFVLPADAQWSEASQALSALKRPEAELTTLRGVIYERSPRCRTWAYTYRVVKTEPLPAQLAHLEKVGGKPVVTFEPLPRE